ncbi:MAG TPA: NAD(P)/FAD-dependent oxidoreductase [Candidatus Acidoferrales bacterium]|nr:NAD(P)/FAD-dependent oxidoreductase [Candidatus Acidoferrales bacterium]
MARARREYDAVVIGSGPNGLAAAITMAQAGRSVLVLEGEQTIGGGTRTAELTLPGFRHDVCSTVHAMATVSPFFRGLPLAAHGLEWIRPPAPLAHPLDDGTAVLLDRSVEATAANLGADGEAYARTIGPLAADWPRLESILLGALRMPRHPFAEARFGWLAMQPASRLARRIFGHERGRALFAGLAAHSILPLERVPSAAAGLALALAAHVGGWPFARGGSQAVADALASLLRSLGGEIETGVMVRSLDELPAARAVLCDVAPRQLAQIAGGRLPGKFRRKLDRYCYGPGVCKLDWALDAPIPWTAAECARAGTVHLGGTIEEIEESERAPWRGETAARPFVLLAQPSLFDATRAPAGKHVAWAYCHVPNGSRADMSEHIESQIERFAPGFRRLILKRSMMPAASLERHNPNLIGGDVAGGAMNLRQFVLRPTRRLYRTPARGVYICSSSTPPGGGVHGICGYLAAKAALRDVF